MENQGSLDIDVVGISNLDLSAFRPDGENLYFDSGVEYGLFGDDETSLQQTSSFSPLNIVDKDDIYGNSRSPAKNDKSSLLLSNKIYQRKSKNWNDTEKDLFQKGLEMFGYNWRKISSFIGTKTVRQVQVYYKQWSETANVIQESANLTSDSCIYLSQAESDSYSSLSNLSPVLTVLPIQSETRTENELVVSPLNNSSLGSQVLVVDMKNIVTGNEEEENRSSDGDKELQINEDASSLQKRKRKYSSKKRQKASIDGDKNIIGMPKPHIQINEGQIIRLKNTMDSDEDIDVGVNDDDDSFNEEYPSEANNSEEFSRLSEEEKKLCGFLWPADLDAGTRKFVDIKNFIINYWKQTDHKFLSFARVMMSLKHVKEPKAKISKVFDIVEENGFINSNSPPRKRLRKHDYRRKERKNVKIIVNKTFEGGTTTSHDPSGAPIDVFHVSENHQNLRKKNSIKLQNYFLHNPHTPAPFSPVIHPLAFITLDTHAHSSRFEVMGLLGGHLDLANQMLFISSAIPTEAKSSAVSCEMCPLDQIEAAKRIRNSGSDVVGWYHSHPNFVPNPSDRDVSTQSAMQKMFRRNDAPFLGLIISPFYFTAGSDSSLVRCMILDDTPREQRIRNNREVIRSNREVPFRLPWSIDGSFEFRRKDSKKRVTENLKFISSSSSSASHWESEYKDGRNFAHKLSSSLQFHLPKSSEKLVAVVNKVLLRPS